MLPGIITILEEIANTKFIKTGLQLLRWLGCCGVLVVDEERQGTLVGERAEERKDKGRPNQRAN